MTLVQKLLLAGVPTVAAGGAGVGVMLMRNSKEENGSLNGGELQQQVISGIKVGEDAQKTDGNEDQIREAGLNCGDGKKSGTNCGIGSTGLNVDRDGKKVGLFPVSGADNGNIKFWLSDDTTTYTDKFRFTVIEKPIKLQGKDKTSETITLDRYENYGLVKEGEKVYLTRKLTAEQWIKKSLGLPEGCTFPTKESPTPSNNSCVPTKDEIKKINFDGKQDGGATTTDNVNLKIYLANDTKTFPGGYRFSFQPHQEITIANDNKLAKDVWWDFRLKDPDAENLVLEKVWKSDTDLLNTVGLTCNGNSTCTINDGSLKIKVGESSMENGKKKDGSTGTIYLEKNRSGHYEGLRFTVWGGGITIENSATPTNPTLEMKEAEIFHISKEDKNDSSYYLTLKHGVKEMILYHLGLNSNGCSLPDAGATKTCTIPSSDLNKIKFHEGGAEKTITGNGNLSVTITIVSDQDKSKYPFGYKFSLKTDSGEVKVGTSISLTTADTEFKIKKDDSKKKLYLEKVSE